MASFYKNRTQVNKKRICNTNTLELRHITLNVLMLKHAQPFTQKFLNRWTKNPSRWRKKFILFRSRKKCCSGDLSSTDIKTNLNKENFMPGTRLLLTSRTKPSCKTHQREKFSGFSASTASFFQSLQDRNKSVSNMSACSSSSDKSPPTPSQPMKK